MFIIIKIIPCPRRFFQSINSPQPASDTSYVTYDTAFWPIMFAFQGCFSAFVCVSKLFSRIFGETPPLGPRQYIGEFTPLDDLICS